MIILFPLAAILFSLVALVLPELFIPFKSWIIYLLGLVMFGMGLTLTLADFRRVAKQPLIIFLGLLLQFFLMPLLALLWSTTFSLADILLTGFVLLGACPGGTASNVICYLARGNVALSISMTACSTLIAVILTPWLTWLYVGEKITVPVNDMIWLIAKVILLPVIVGVAVNHLFHNHVKSIVKVLPLFSMCVITFIIAIIVALNATNIGSLLPAVAVVVILHNLGGLLLGYCIPRSFGLDHKTCKTLAIEVGMQNSGLAVTLASQFFPPLAALPGALFSIWHNVSGSLLACVWSRQSSDEDE